ncbi:putative serine protease EDA2 isoform X1 [Panicum miliaceum]|uniref:Serine protease EDA2 isoform X1 n=1 Tax=Panicum miliaceum TaxID=4540 RepID=A0A3L6SG26_PANMI|nr:putative serine protease EDA2 isoform X1 [Panicum miliaceum]
MGSRARLVSLLFAFLLARVAEAGPPAAAAGSRYLTKDERWMSQRLDHFSPTDVFYSSAVAHAGGHGSQDHRRFKQRYFEFLDYHRAPGGPIFLRICGESACGGIPNDYLAVLAKKFGAAVVTPEHRYYGKSSPFKRLTTENLRFLSSKQALFDLAVFREYYQESLNARYNRTGFDNPWFVIGVSYSGALSAWFRLKFPHLTCGSLASSGVVRAVYNYTDFDRQVGESAGPDCKAALQETTRLVEQQLLSDSRSVKTLFGAQTLKNDDFLYLLADAAAEAFQYGHPDAVCTPLVNAKKNGKNLVETFAQIVKVFYVKEMETPVSSYDQEYLKKTTPDDSSSRLWWFQVCSEVAYFQVAPKTDSVRSARINTKYHLDLCRNVFGEGVYPDVSMTNLYYGGTRIAVPSYLMKCSNCGHGTDLRGCPQSPFRIQGDSSNCSSPAAVNTVRQQIAKYIDLWLSQCQKPSASGYGSHSPLPGNF